jgi:hypothetical protein
MDNDASAALKVSPHRPGGRLFDHAKRRIEHRPLGRETG